MKEIKVLIIDDEVAEEIKESLEDYKFQGFPLAVDAVETCKAGKAKLCQLRKNKDFYDVVVVDMKMEDSEVKGMDIVNLSLPGITIVLTALATVDNCIQCLNAGVFDYIDKNSLKYNPFDRLKDTIRNGLNQRLSGPVLPVEEWKETNLDRLSKQYRGQHIAIIAEKVVDSGPDLYELQTRVKKKFPYLLAEYTCIPGPKDENSSEDK